jgi:Fic family protein
MMTLRQFSKSPPLIPTATAWHVADLSEALGKQELFTRQSPQKLKALQEHALIESAISSNRIEGVEVDQKRVATIIFGRSRLRDRDEEEVRGYRNALNLIHSKGKALPMTEETIRHLHALTRGGIGDAGDYKTRDGDIIETYADGRSRVRFKPVSAKETPAAMAELIELWSACLQERWIHPFIALAAFNLDFLCVHPFRDGNGRTSRLLLLLGAYHLGMEVGRFISLERLIEENKERYYETLEHCSRGWHQGKHEPWMYINHVLFTLKTAYGEFERRVGETTDAKGAKAELVLQTVASLDQPFKLSDIERLCPGVGREWIRRILANLRAEKKLVCRGHGAGARWQKVE